MFCLCLEGVEKSLFQGTRECKILVLHFTMGIQVYSLDQWTGLDQGRTRATLNENKNVEMPPLTILAPFTLTSLDRAKRGSLFSAC